SECGDGVLVKTLEECDDGNVVDGDGCSSDCKLEPDGGALDAGVVDASAPIVDASIATAPDAARLDAAMAPRERQRPGAAAPSCGCRLTASGGGSHAGLLSLVLAGGLCSMRRRRLQVAS